MQSDIDYAYCSFYTSLLPIIELVKHASFFKGYIFCFPESVFISLRHGGSSLMTSHTASLTPPFLPSWTQVDFLFKASCYVDLNPQHVS